MMKVLDGKVLRVDLTSRDITFEGYDRYREWMGGQGVNQFILFNELPVGISPYSPFNILAVGTGALAGTSAPGAGRTNIDSLNAFTGGIGSSNAGGYFARELAFAGISNIIFTGSADNLVYLCIDDGRVEIIDGSHLRKRNVSETAEILRRDHGDDFKSMVIGPAGENLVRSACIILDQARAAGRCGLGAVMGSKNLKAVVVRGTGIVEPADPDAFDAAVKVCVEKITSSAFAKDASKYGVYRRDPWHLETPYRNFSGEIPSPEKKQKIIPEAFLPYMVDSKTCGPCPMECWKVYRVQQGDRSVVSEALQINAIHNFAARLDLFDPEIVLKAHARCNDLGLDEDNVCAVISWAIDCYERGLITKEDAGGLALRWGDQETIFKLFESIAYRQGFGDVLAEGCLRASERFPGTRDHCVHVKGQELFESLWGRPAWNLGTVVAARGGTHTRGAAYAERFQNTPEELCEKLLGLRSVGGPDSYEHKEYLVFFFEKLQALSNAFGMCYFVHGLNAPDMLLPEDYARLFSGATGQELNEERLMWFGERIFNLEKCFNVLHTKWSRDDDMPPDRFVSRPLDGKLKIDLQAWNEMLDRYYQLHGWDKGTGKPRKETFDRLHLHDIRKRLEREGKMP